MSGADYYCELEKVATGSNLNYEISVRQELVAAPPHLLHIRT